MEEANRFGLRRTLSADLRRYHGLVDPDGATPGRARLAAYLVSARFAPVLLCRLSHWLFLRRFGPLAKLVSLVNFAVFGIEIAARCPIGEGLFLPHTLGTVIGAEAIGRNATIYHNVTLGARDIDLGYTSGHRPTVGDNVLIGSGAKVLGGVAIGNGCRIGANALVVRSMPPGALARAPAAEIVDSLHAGPADR